MAKPNVAFISEERARENITRKLKRLGMLLKQEVLLGEAPKSLNQFNAWTYASDVVDESFVSNAHLTLSRYSDLKIAAENLTGLAKAASKPARPVREISVKRARERADLHLQLRQIAERHALQVMSENGDLRRQVEALKSQVDSMVEELDVIRADYEEEIQKIRQRNAELVRSKPRKITALRKDV